MKGRAIGVITFIVFVLIGVSASAQSVYVVQSLIESWPPCKEYEHPHEVVLADGFWAKTGSAVTATIARSDVTPEQGLLGVQNMTYCNQPAARLGLVEGLNYSGSHDVQSGAGAASQLVQAGTDAKLPNPVQFYAVRSIYIEEETQNPCRIVLFGRTIDPRFQTSKNRRLGEFTLDSCKGMPFTDGNLAELDEPDNRFIQGLRVCMGGKRVYSGGVADPNELKGLRIRPATVSEDGAVKPRDDVLEWKEWKERNCPEQEMGGSGDGWASWSTCQDNEIVTGVVVYYRKKVFLGLGVVCGKVRFLPIPQTLVKDESGF